MKEAIGCVMETHRFLGLGLLEPAHEQCRARDEEEQGSEFHLHIPVLVEYKLGRNACGHRLDVLLDKQRVLEREVADAGLRTHEAQRCNRTTRLRLGGNLCDLGCVSPDGRTAACTGATHPVGWKWRVSWRRSRLLRSFITTGGFHSMAGLRLNYDDSIRRLQELGVLGTDERPPLPDHVPQPEDGEPLGLSFFRTFLGDGADLSNLTIPRTFFGRSEIRDTSFRNTDLTESNLRWNDFINVDFSDAMLANADLRASIYTGVRFLRTDLRGADMRLGDYEDCVFDGARMDGVLMTRAQAAKLKLDARQLAAIAWCADDGPEPSGG